jgi:ribokinase/sulfofructose kinase
MDKKGRSMVFDVVGLHGLNYDLSAAVQRLPQHDEKVSARLLSSLPGGPVGNFACAASKLGLRVAVHAHLGDDNFSERILQEFKTYGVDTRWIEQEAGRTADLALIFVDPSGEKAIVVVEPAPVSSDPPETIFRELITKTRGLFLTMYSFVEFRSRLDAARLKGVQVMIDIEDTPQVGQVSVTDILNSCDIASFNHAGFLA